MKPLLVVSISHIKQTNKAKLISHRIIKKALLVLLATLPFLVYSQDEKDAMDSIFVRSQDSTKIKKINFNSYPYAFYSPETQAAIGGGGIVLFYTKKTNKLRPSKIGFGAHYTTNNQYKFSLNPSIYFNANNLVVNMPVSFGHTLDKFWGIGNKSKETGTEEYFREDFNFQLEIQVPPLLFFSDRSGFILEYKKTDIVDAKDNALIKDELVNGFKGGDLYGVGVNLIWDRRDNVFYPTSGHYQYIKFIVYPDISDYVFTTFEIDVRHYKKLLKNQILASNLYIKSVSENAPFYELAALGGQHRMRGYFQGRYRDNLYFTFQTEWRQTISKKFGFVAFAGIGDVGNEITDLSMGELKYSLGGGLRYLFNEKENVNIRMDIAAGRDGNLGVYFGIEESF